MTFCGGGNTVRAPCLARMQVSPIRLASEGLKQSLSRFWKRLGRVPDRVFVGVGGWGDGIYGIWKGFRELLECGVARPVPRMIACQTEGANSLVRAFRKGEQVIVPLDSVHTVASSLAERTWPRVSKRSAQCTTLRLWRWRLQMKMRWPPCVGWRAGVSLWNRVRLSLWLAFHQLLEDETDSAAGETWVSIGSGAAPKWPEDCCKASPCRRYCQISKRCLTGNREVRSGWNNEQRND